jgi:membrane-associated phospholipid phosphatase
MRGTRGRLALCAATMLMASHTMLAPTATAQTPLAGDSAKKEARRLFNKQDALIAGGFAVTTVLLFPLDREIAQTLQNPDAQANRFFRNASTGFEVIASPGAYLIGGSLFVVGRVTGMRRLADLGWHGTEAVLLAEVMTNALKNLAGRARPYVTDADDPNNFTLGGGWGNGARRSFPSGHTSTAFAAAASVTAEAGAWWPQHKVLIGTVMYGGASAVGLSRMYNNRHWASDVALGALIGTFSGWKVIQFTHDNPGNKLDRIMVGATVVPYGDGVMVGWRW